MPWFSPTVRRQNHANVDFFQSRGDSIHQNTIDITAFQIAISNGGTVIAYTLVRLGNGVQRHPKEKRR